MNPLLTEETLAAAVAALAERDADLAAVVARFGPPPLWARPPGFATLAYVILEQQVSLASARAAFNRLQVALDQVTPEGFLTLDDETLRRIGFSRQKTGYVRGLAQVLATGGLDLAALEEMEDAAAQRALLALRGVGPWTANIYLLMALRRPDAWPAGDLGLQVAAQEVKGLRKRPGPDALEALAEPWRPWRAAAARILWHHYLSLRRPAGAPEEPPA